MRACLVHAANPFTCVICYCVVCLVCQCGVCVCVCVCVSVSHKVLGCVAFQVKRATQGALAKKVCSASLSQNIRV